MIPAANAASCRLQECERMNVLVGEIVRTLSDLCLAFKVTQRENCTDREESDLEDVVCSSFVQ